MTLYFGRAQRGASRRRQLIGALLLAGLSALSGVAPAQGMPPGTPPAPRPPATQLVLGSIVPETRFIGRWHALIFPEAFRRLGLTVRIEHYPTQRLSVSADQGMVDGDTARSYDYQADHPELVRVEEPLFETTFALFTTEPSVAIGRLEDLPGSGLRGVYMRGVGVCSKGLASWLPPERLTDVREVTQGWQMVLSGRADFICTSDISVIDVFSTPEFRGRAEARRLVGVAVTPLFVYLHRRHEALAPRLALALREMKAEGLIERYRLAAMAAVQR